MQLVPLYKKQKSMALNNVDTEFGAKKGCASEVFK